MKNKNLKTIFILILTITFLLCILFVVASYAIKIRSEGEQKASINVSSNKKLQSENKLKNKDVDFQPYMNEMQVKIKKNWNPPNSLKSKRIIVLFKIGKDGKLLSAKILKSSGSKKADNAALKALQDAQPFKALPKQCKDKSINVQFTFDYNVWGKK